MASGGKEKQKEQELQGKIDQSIAKVEAVNPLQQQINTQTQRVLDWENGTGEFAGQARDVTKLLENEPVLDLYGNAQNLADQEMYGQGAGAFSNTANGAYGDQLKMQDQFIRDQARAQAVSNAAQAIRAQAHGTADTSIERDINRNLAVANLNNQNLQNYYNRPRTAPWWQTAISLAAGGVQAASGLGSLGWQPLKH